MDAVPAEEILKLTVGRAAVGGEEIPVVALFSRFEDVVTADGLRLFLIAVLVAAVTRVGISVVALLARFLDSVAAHRVCGLFDLALFVAFIARSVVSIVALFP